MDRLVRRGAGVVAARGGDVVCRAVYAALAIVLLVATAACSSATDFRGDTVEATGPAPLTGVNWDGSRFDLASLDHDVAVVFFGYTFCPDVCPITLARMKRLYGELGERRAERVAVVFVSVDPERDSLAKLAEYVPGFDPRFFGVRAEGDELTAAKSSFGVSARNLEPAAGGDPDFYFVDHTGSMFLLDDERRPRVIHPFEAELADVVADVETLLAEAA